jgi:ketosteroid isomerase-like protein
MPEHAPEVEAVVRRWLAAKQAGDADGIGELLSLYPGALAIGTDVEEWWPGAEAFAGAHTATGPFAASVELVEAHREGPAAWAAVRAIIETGQPGGFPVRLTLVLVQAGDGWKIVQSHASTPPRG